MAMNRVLKDMRKFQKECDTQDMVRSLDFANGTDAKDYWKHLKATIAGPPGSDYGGGLFDVAIEIPAEFPHSPPKLWFLSPVLHVNVGCTGAICLDILKENWCPVMSLVAVLNSLCGLLESPNPDDPLNQPLAELYHSNPIHYQRVIQESVQSLAASSSTLPVSSEEVVRG
eukprot:NODE_1691_length_872_cov_171.362090_g1329_i0.p1 GENE.NODE_1691_length_872_cov_171.362090_g1329_i0~~NODE_1691_length_872_cov_171.362090_g1329_i0.p1  ORF type:complete len:171 (-),score=37.85 NODE_1691_length_872_cov_171.362090_g1329_i0:295-807(-)